MDEQLPDTSAPFPEEGSPLPSVSAPFYQIWILVLTRPRESTFHALIEDPGATVARGALWVFLTSLIAYLIATALQFGQLMALMGSTEELEALGGIGAAGGLALLCLVPFVAGLAVLGLMVSTAILQFVAGALGGVGTFRELFFASAAYTSPVTLIGSILGAIPIVGGCLALPLSLYSVYLNALAVKSVNRFGWGSTIITLIIPGLIVVLVITVLFLLLLLPLLQSGEFGDFAPYF